MKRIQLVIVDPQNSFCKVVPPDHQQVLHDGELCIPGAWDDMERVAKVVTRLGNKLDDITVTLDSHNILHIAHPMWFKDVKTGMNPQPFTMMRVHGTSRIIGAMSNAATGNWDDVGEFRTAKHAMMDRTVAYLKALAAGKRYPHIIWPPHGLIGTSGHSIVAPLLEALLAWERENVGIVQKVAKGSNVWVEHFSAVRAEVLDPEDPTTATNTDLIESLMEADEILWAGVARSHTLANTFRDIANTFNDNAFIKKSVLLEDGTSDVPGFEAIGQSFLGEMRPRGLRLIRCSDYLA